MNASMNADFPVGIYQFHKEPNFNYQMNRWTTFGKLPTQDIRNAAARIRNLKDWKREFLLLAQKAHETREVLQEAFYYRAVDFFLPYKDPEKERIYQKLVSLLRDAYQEYFENKSILELEVDYDGIKLPVYYAANRSTEPSNGTVVLTGGFDCYKEELIPVINYFADNGYDFYYFEGPGQGEVLHKYKYPMTNQWEKPVKAVLDAFGLTEVTLIGLSLGGYLAPRAAAYEPRIIRVIAWGAIYDFFNVVSTRRGKGLAFGIYFLSALRIPPLFNLIVSLKMKLDPYAYWGVDHGMNVMGATSPYQYFRKLKLFNTKRISRFVKQDFLLLAGANDHFCEIKMFYKQAKILCNVHSFTGRIFTAAESADNHCQFGNLELALRQMTNWIENI